MNESLFSKAQHKVRSMLRLDQKNPEGQSGKLQQMEDSERRSRYIEWASRQDGAQVPSFADWLKAGEPD